MENLLRELREQANLTQEELAGRVGVSRQTIISLERGRYNPSLVLAYDLARVFGLKIEDVFLLDEKEGRDTGEY
ncbi:MAG: helix-turn-helix transcriptional regulator [Syntrophomonadaceae bacterium]|nr:helix-turn-helix transcriptional regulator [Syntrophomonadaceae bacterium]